MLPIAKLAIVSGGVLCMGLLSACGGSRNAPPPKRPGLQRLQGAKPTPAVGIPAIPAKSVPAGQVGFTDADARSWVQSHPVAGSLPKLSHLDKVLSVQFLLEQSTAPLLYGERIGNDPARMLCLVMVSGDFAWSTPEKKQVVRYPLAAEVFDARTGDFLLSAGLPKAAGVPNSPTRSGIKP